MFYVLANCSKIQCNASEDNGYNLNALYTYERNTLREKKNYKCKESLPSGCDHIFFSLFQTLRYFRAIFSTSPFAFQFSILKREKSSTATKRELFLAIMYAFTVEPFNKEIKTMDDYGMAKKNAPNYRAYFEINILIKSLICRKKSLTLLIKTF